MWPEAARPHQARPPRRVVVLVTVVSGAVLLAGCSTRARPPDQSAVFQHHQPGAPHRVFSGPSGASQGAIYRQQLLDDVVARALQTPDQSGFAGSSIDIGTLTVTLQWTSSVPDDIQNLAGVTDTGVTVSVVVVALSVDQVSAGARKVFVAAEAGEVPVPNVIGAGVGGSGLRIEVKPSDLDRARAASQRFAEIAGMPVDIVAGQPEPPQPL
jgi:hypothetical protein